MKRNPVLLSFLISAFLLSACKKDTYEQTGYDQEILAAVNAHRIEIGLQALEHNDFIWQLAHDYSKGMADGSIPFGHQGITEIEIKIEEELGLGNVSLNIAWGEGSAEELVNKWLASAGHKSNIEGNYTLTGLSAVKSKNGKWYYTQIFYKNTDSKHLN